MGGSQIGYATLALVVLGLVLTVVWIVLPFAVIGTKALLRQILREQQVTNQLLVELRDQAKRGS